MPEYVRLTDVAEALESETRRALAAAKRIPLRAMRVGYELLVDFAADHVYSGAFLASISVGLGELNDRSVGITQISDTERHRRHRTGDVFGPPPIRELDQIARDFEFGDIIVVGTEIRYAGLIDALFDEVLTSQLDQVVQAEVERGINDFNRRSEAAIRGAGGDVF